MRWHADKAQRASHRDDDANANKRVAQSTVDLIHRCLGVITQPHHPLVRISLAAAPAVGVSATACLAPGATSSRHGYVGVEHLLISLRVPEAPETARLLAAHGLTTQRTRDAVGLVVGSGRGDGPRLDPATLLATLGIDLDQIRRHVEAQFGPNAIHT